MQFISPVLISILGRVITPSHEAEQSTPILKYGKARTKKALKSCRRRLGVFFRGKQNWAYCGFIWNSLSGLIFRIIRFSHGIRFGYLSTPMYFFCQLVNTVVCAFGRLLSHMASDPYHVVWVCMIGNRNCDSRII
jgi:hypothetical protein